MHSEFSGAPAAEPVQPSEVRASATADLITDGSCPISMALDSKSRRWTLQPSLHPSKSHVPPAGILYCTAVTAGGLQTHRFKPRTPAHRVVYPVLPGTDSTSYLRKSPSILCRVCGGSTIIKNHEPANLKTSSSSTKSTTMPTTKPKNGQRYRICGTPSRLGCLTCKIRRVKCGEEKPFCKRCTSTGRKCDGYGPPKPAHNSAVAQRTPSLPKCNPTTTCGENPLEQRLLYFFATATAPSLTGTFSSEFWENKVVQMSMVEPTIQHAVIAIAAIHQDFVNRHHSRGANYDSSLQTFAFRQYTKAISNLHNLMSTRAHQMDLTLISCILFITIDCLLGNHASAIIHLKAGLRILQNIKSQREQKGLCDAEWERNYSPPLIALGVQAATFVNPHLQKERTELWTFLTTAGLHSKPMVFTSLDTARYALDTIVAEIMTDRTSTNSILAHTTPDPSGVAAHKHLAALHSWSQALSHFITSFISLDPSASKPRQGATLLKVHSLVVSIVIGRPEDADEKFEDILALCEYLITTGGCFTSTLTNLNFAADQGVIAPLFFTALRAPDPSAKARALALLARAPGREGMWDTEDAIRVAEGAQKSDSLHVPITAVPMAPVTDDVVIWLDVAARLKAKVTWPFGERQPVEAGPVPFQGGMGMAMSPGEQAEAPDYMPKYAWLLRRRRGSDVTS
ncbi:uncharacterized protein LY89DRAFT_717622 [Mollisia scopiformis]|uniref:Zn(2)-C6 fungal-type domain-containing protein n=1 Tax=Mollisia scopiformis TaxID=149040 RepID=A0A194XE11_MOLSC|nr:uncharacterized protein LY89DRAFT_717622 [Mollisia scopiformis]KUJ17987.1 hypothetical protein LY89DRAFT_717622 [Mollisia scopiformis]